MDQETMNSIRLHERVATLENKYQHQQDLLEDISVKLDSLLELKAKGMGAIGLVTLVVGSGFIGIIALVINAFKGGVHL